ncbi:amino acid ABC transporter permease [Staphylococcus equorum]|uniref:Amino acid ABC transporter permease n=1 Tax=Staphylococcus equorum TaxID=246432 RepID=A0A9X4LA97_9STAP|nr:amino acid ABC transporter permease [Staphylococcus equorum]MDG0843581.1 amino acid ABC transporter permease [Staphylococcus equorum]MDG0859865.1 amino acid ABC transporter permease [Staphylococcus equorum]
MSFILSTISEVLKGVPNTIIISIVAMLVGLIIGTLFAIIRIKRVPVLSQLIIVYNSFFRSTPLIVQLFILYYGIPSFILFLNDQFTWAINPDIFSPLAIAFIVFSFHAVAYLSESIKGGLQSVDQTQIEAAQTVGLSRFSIYKEIVLPQAFAYALPNIENQFIMLIKGTSLAFAVQVTEIMAVSRVIANEGYRFIPVYTVAALFYWLLAIILEFIFAKMERNTTRYLRANAS